WTPCQLSFRTAFHERARARLDGECATGVFGLVSPRRPGATAAPRSHGPRRLRYRRRRSPRRRRRAPAWVGSKTPPVGGRWVRLGGRTYYGARRETRQRLPAGLYTLERDHEGDIIFERRDLEVDALVRFPGSIADQLLREIEAFWSLAPAFAAHGFLHRRGYLLYGPHGCGKSSIVRQVVHDVVQRDGVVLVCGAPAVLTRGLVVLRRIEPVRPVVCVLEDIDAIVAAHGDEELLSLLDGESQVDHVLNLATTNYPEQLHRRFVARPRR